MATEKQIAANRANARLSTGPKSLVGKQRSSRNAYRHGLSRPLQSDPLISAKVDIMARALAGEQASETELASATTFARAHFELLRIRSLRNEIAAQIELTNERTQKLRQLVALDRYERYSHTKRRKIAPIAILLKRAVTE